MSKKTAKKKATKKTKKKADIQLNPSRGVHQRGGTLGGKD